MSKYDLSILDKFVTSCPRIVFLTKVFSHKFISADTISTGGRRRINGLKYFTYQLRGVIVPTNLVSPFICMSFSNVFSIITKQFQVLDSVVGFIVIYMMNPLLGFEFPSQMLLHNKGMFKNTFAVNVNAYITKFSNSRFVVSMAIRSVRNVVTLVSKPPTSMHLTYLPRSLSQYILTIFDSTSVTFSHVTIITQRIN